jgi:hypothetical protein
MNSLDFLIYGFIGFMAFMFMVCGYAIGVKDGRREGYTRGRSVSRAEFWRE